MTRRSAKGKRTRPSRRAPPPPPPPPPPATGPARCPRRRARFSSGPAFLFKFDSAGPGPDPDAHDRDGVATVYDKACSSPMTHLGSLAEDHADALDELQLRGVADGGNAVVSGNGGNGRRHEQLDELEDLVATIGLHKAVACLRSALGTVAGDEVPPLVARDGSCAGAMRADDREFCGSVLSG